MSLILLTLSLSTENLSGLLIFAKTFKHSTFIAGGDRHIHRKPLATARKAAPSSDRTPNPFWELGNQPIESKTSPPPLTSNSSGVGGVTDRHVNLNLWNWGRSQLLDPFSILRFSKDNLYRTSSETAIVTSQLQQLSTLLTTQNKDHPQSTHSSIPLSHRHIARHRLLSL